MDNKGPTSGKGNTRGKMPRAKPILSIVPDANAKVVRLSAGQGKDANGLTARQEQFCQGVGSQGMSQSDAYRAAYNAQNMTAQNVNNEAYKLMCRPEIISRVNVLTAERRARTSLDSNRIRQHVIDKLWAESQATGNTATARIRALELLGKMTDVSLFTERVQTETVAARDAKEIEQAIREKLAKLA
jgi:hypothetical protein